MEGFKKLVKLAQLLYKDDAEYDFEEIEKNAVFPSLIDPNQAGPCCTLSGGSYTYQCAQPPLPDPETYHASIAYENEALSACADRKLVISQNFGDLHLKIYSEICPCYSCPCTSQCYSTQCGCVCSCWRQGMACTIIANSKRKQASVGVCVAELEANLQLATNLKTYYWKYLGGSYDPWAKFEVCESMEWERQAYAWYEECLSAVSIRHWPYNSNQPECMTGGEIARACEASSGFPNYLNYSNGNFAFKTGTEGEFCVIFLCASHDETDNTYSVSISFGPSIKAEYDANNKDFNIYFGIGVSLGLGVNFGSVSIEFNPIQGTRTYGLGKVRANAMGKYIGGDFLLANSPTDFL